MAQNSLGERAPMRRIYMTNRVDEIEAPGQQRTDLEREAEAWAL